MSDKDVTARQLLDAIPPGGQLVRLTYNWGIRKADGTCDLWDISTDYLLGWVAEKLVKAGVKRVLEAAVEWRRLYSVPGVGDIAIGARQELSEAVDAYLSDAQSLGAEHD